MEREFQSKKRYVAAFIIGTILFIIGLLISYSLSYSEFRRISSLHDSLAYSIFEDKLDYSFFNSNLCSNETYMKVFEDLSYQGRIIDDLERKFGKDDESVLFRKKFYSLVEIEHFEFVNTLNQKCHLNISTILFFYSNDEKEIGNSEYVGGLLDYIVDENKNLVVYSFDYNIDSEVVKKLKLKYQVDKPFTLIVNNNFKIVAPSKVEDVNPYINVTS